MLDKYLYGDTDRISPEAPVMVLNVTHREQRPGGAGSVAVDLSSLGAEILCAGVMGDDENGRNLRTTLAALRGVNVEGFVIDGDRPTTCKERVIGLAQHRHRQQLMRIDEESAAAISEPVRKELMKHLLRGLDWCDVVCLEDYNKGMLDGPMCQSIIRQAQTRGKHVLIDPAAVSDYSPYRGAWMIKPNRRELSLATGVKMGGEATWLKAAGQLADQFEIEHVVVTLDKQGSYVYSRKEKSGELVPTRVRDVYDVTGAGDMVLAMLGLLEGARSAGTIQANLREIVCLANVAGGLEVERFGSEGIEREEILAELAQERHIQTGKLRRAEELFQELSWHRKQKKKIVFTNGCFDILHPGHIRLLSFAKEQGDILVVAINSDASVRGLKGPTRPILTQQNRAALLSALEAVDYIVIFDTPDPLWLIEKISPEVLIKGSDWQGAVVGQEWVERHGGEVKLMPLEKGLSTTNIIAKVLEANANSPSGQR